MDADSVHRVWHRCEFMLLYLTSSTWTSGRESGLLAMHVSRAISRGVPIVLAHEMQGVGQAGRRPTHMVHSHTPCTLNAVHC